MLPAGADKSPLDGHETFQPFEGQLQQALPSDQWDELLGLGGTAHRPQTGPGPTCDNQCKSHG